MSMMEDVFKECDILQRLEESALVIKHWGHFYEGNDFYIITELAQNGDLQKKIDVFFIYCAILFTHIFEHYF